VPIIEESQTWEQNYLKTLSKLGMKAPEKRPFLGVFDPMPEAYKPPTNYQNPTTSQPLPGDSIVPQK
jgi:hypothetical protein